MELNTTHQGCAATATATAVGVATKTNPSTRSRGYFQTEMRTRPTAAVGLHAKKKSRTTPPSAQKIRRKIANTLGDP